MNRVVNKERAPKVMAAVTKATAAAETEGSRWSEGLMRRWLNVK
ncbi:hypothetical protein [Streptomyces albireticuli]|nr:hypothetical protein [Streptomyces albireticuli]